MIEAKLISRLADVGVHFVNTTPGLSRSNEYEWQLKATQDTTTIKEWLDAGYGLVSVAKPDGAYLLDIDDCQACDRTGFNFDWVKDWFYVVSPSSTRERSRRHYYGIQDDRLRGLTKSIITVSGAGGPILELKLNNHTVAAPGTERFGMPGKTDGVYRARPFSGLRAGMPEEMLAWILREANYCPTRKRNRQFAPDFEPLNFFEHFDLDVSEHQRGNKTLYCFEICPNCGAQPSKWDGCVWIWDEEGFYFSCFYCGVGMKDLMDRLEKQHGRYEGPMYASWFQGLEHIMDFED